MMISETWIPDGPSERARDSARLRWAALAEANATVLAPPRRDAVAPMKIMLPSGAPLHRGDDATRGGEGTKCVGPPRRLEIFEGHLLGGAPNPLARIVNKDIDRSEVQFDGFEGLLHHCWVAHIASIGARDGKLLRQSAGEATATGQQRDGISLCRKSTGERGTITGTDADDGTDWLLSWLSGHGDLYSSLG